MEGVWKDVIGYESIYKVSDMGNIISLPRNRHKGNNILKPCLSNCGYQLVALNKNGIHKTHTVHKLVAVAFLSFTPNNRVMVINHKDGNKQNNNVSNLEIVKFRDNLNSCFRRDIKTKSSGLMGVTIDKRNGRWISRVYINRKRIFLGSFTTEEKANEAYRDAILKHEID